MSVSRFPVQPLAVQQAARALAAGGVIAHPTESVWGLACDPNNLQAVERLLTLKNRRLEKGLILVSADEADFSPLLDNLSAQQLQQLHATWPGPVTWLVPHFGRVPPWISGAHHSVALRCTDHPFTAALTCAFGGAIVSTSANPAGCVPPRHKYQVLRYFGSELDFVGGGATGGRRAPSEIRDLTSGAVMRPGS